MAAAILSAPSFCRVGATQVTVRESQVRILRPSLCVAGGTLRRQRFHRPICASSTFPRQTVHLEQEVIYLGKPDGPTCHTGSETCYYSSVSDALREEEEKEHRLALSTLYSLENIISCRRDEVTEENAKPSWTKRLLNDPNFLCSKVREEAEELVQTLLSQEDDSRVASEMADLM